MSTEDASLPGLDTGIRTAVCLDAAADQTLLSAMEALLQISTDPILLFNRQGICLHAGAAWANALALPAAEIAGKSVQEIGLPPEPAVSFAAQAEQVFQSRRKVTGTLRVPIDEGVRLFELRFAPLFDEQGAVSAALCIARDVTETALLESENRRAERALRDSEQRLELVTQAAGLGLYRYDVRTGEIVWDDRCKELFGLPSRAGGITIETFWAAVHPEDRERLAVAIANALDPVSGGTFSADYRTIGLQDGGRTRWLTATGRVAFEESGQATCLTGIVQDCTEARQSEQSLRRQKDEIAALNRNLQRRLQEIEAIFETVPVAVTISEDPDCNKIWGNATTYQMLRLPAGVNVSQTGPMNERPPFRVFRDGRQIPGDELPMQIAARTGQEVRNAELDIVWDDGATCRWYGGALPLFDEQGAVRGSVGAFVDITERKLAVEALQRAHDRLELAQETARMGIYEWNLVTGEVAWSPQMEALYGLPQGSFEGDYAAWARRVHPEDLAQMEADVPETFRRGSDTRDFRVVWTDGSVRWLHMCSRILYNAQNEPERVLGVNLDITARKQTEDSLRHSEERLRFALDAAMMMAWSWNLETGQVSREGDLTGVLGSPSLSQSDVSTELLQIVHPDDRRRLRHATLLALQGRQSYDISYRILLPDGTARWIADVGRVQRSADGTPIRFNGIARNVTAQKEAEIALRKSEEQFRQQARLLETLLDNIPTGITIATPPDVRIRKVSRYGSQISGVDSTEMEGCPQSGVPGGDVYHSDGVTLARDEELPLTRATMRGETVQGEEWILIRRATGEKMTILCNASPVRDENGSILYGILTWDDISILKAAQEEIARLNARLHRAIYEASHRIKNQLQLLSATTDMVLMDNPKEVPVRVLRRLHAQIGAIATTHDLLTFETRSEGTADHISIQALLTRTLKALQQTTSHHLLRYTLEDGQVSVKTGTSLALITSEAVLNAIKHGSALVEIALSRSDGIGRLEVCDDGPGFPAGFDPHYAAHTGLELLMTLARIDLGGTSEFGNRAEGGARVVVEFPWPAET